MLLDTQPCTQLESRSEGKDIIGDVEDASMLSSDIQLPYCGHYSLAPLEDMAQEQATPGSSQPTGPAQHTTGTDNSISINDPATFERLINFLVECTLDIRRSGSDMQAVQGLTDGQLRAELIRLVQEIHRRTGHQNGVDRLWWATRILALDAPLPQCSHSQSSDVSYTDLVSSLTTLQIQ